MGSCKRWSSSRRISSYNELFSRKLTYYCGGFTTILNTNARRNLSTIRNSRRSFTWLSFSSYIRSDSSRYNSCWKRTTNFPTFRYGRRSCLYSRQNGWNGERRSSDRMEPRRSGINNWKRSHQIWWLW